jgi:hypothetical protein
LARGALRHACLAIAAMPRRRLRFAYPTIAASRFVLSRCALGDCGDAASCPRAARSAIAAMPRRPLRFAHPAIAARPRRALALRARRLRQAASPARDSPTSIHA